MSGGGKRIKGDFCACSRPGNIVKVRLDTLPIIDVMIGGKLARGLVDTGCSTSVVHAKFVPRCDGEQLISAFNGDQVKCMGLQKVNIVVDCVGVDVEAVISERLVEGVDAVIGVDVIDRLGGVTVHSGHVSFGVCGGRVALFTSRCEEKCSGSDSSGIVVRDNDFHASFNGGKWTVKWHWKNGEPVALKNTVGCYDKGLEGRKREEFGKEVNRWIAEGILIPWTEVKSGIIPLMAVEQPTKNKVRPVLDFRELNRYVKCHTGDEVTDVCSETLRKWRQIGDNVSVVDLKSAYLQLGVDKELWPYQLVRYKGQTFCLTRLGFGLNSAPRIMSKILKTVLNQDDRIGRATNSYIDDILVDESIASAGEVIAHLNKYGLITKTPESLDGGAILGLRLSKIGKELVFRRGNKVPEVSDTLTRRQLFSVCGTLVGHYPIAGWLRVACSYIKRRAEGVNWEDLVGEQSLMMINEVIDRVKYDDPVRGTWCVPNLKCGVVWCDASKIAIGVMLEVDGKVAEDAAWLRKQDDFNHINVAELEAVLKGVNLAIRWGLLAIEIKTDSATVGAWLKTVVSEEKRVHTKGAAEMIIKRRLGNLKELISEFGLNITVQLVSSEKNKADVLTRVKKGWLTKGDVEQVAQVQLCAGANIDLPELHSNHHMGVDRTLYLARQINPQVSRESVKRVVRECSRCQSIDPAPTVHEAGEVSIAQNWKRLAIDVTHYQNVPYLSMVDCGPGRFAIWRKMTREDAPQISAELESVFLERGPVDELLMDNSTAFRSEHMRNMLSRWNVSRVFRAAYRPGGNGIVERHHRTIKTIAERGEISPLLAVFWYNSTPRTGQDCSSVPQQSVHTYQWRYPLVVPPKHTSHKSGELAVQMGEEVWVKPPGARCTTQWRKGVVTEINSPNNLSIDGMPRHILDVRPIITADSSSDDTSASGSEDSKSETAEEPSVLLVQEQTGGNPRPRRDTRPPRWMDDYVTD